MPPLLLQGLDVLPPTIFTELERLKTLQSVHGGEVDLRAAMKQHLQQQGRLYSCLVDGTRHDIGTPSVYWKTLQAVYDSNYDIDCHKGNNHFATSLSHQKNSNTLQGTKRLFSSVADNICSEANNSFAMPSGATPQSPIISKPHPIEPEESVERSLLQWLRYIEISSTAASISPTRIDTAATAVSAAVGVRSYSSHAESIGDLHSLTDNSYQEPIHIASSPGRIDLLGGFADYSGSQLLQHSTSQRCFAFAKFTNSHNDILMQTIQVPSIQEILSQGNKNIQDLNIYRKTIPLSNLFFHSDLAQESSQINLISKPKLRFLLEAAMSDITPKHEQLWPSYLVGVLHALLQHAEVIGVDVPLSAGRRIVSFKVDDNGGSAPSVTAAAAAPTAAAAAVRNLNNYSGIEIRIVSDVPWNSGLASSAAVEMSTAMALSRVMGFNSTTLTLNEMALMCQAVENEVVGANCGLMDQLTVANLASHHSDQYVPQQRQGHGHLQQQHLDGQIHSMQQKLKTEMHGPRLAESAMHEKRQSHGQTDTSSLLSLCCRLPLTVPPCDSFSLPSDMSVIAIESGVLRSVADAPYKQVRVASMMGMAIINNHRSPFLSNASAVKQLRYLCDLSLGEFNTEYRDLLPVMMTGREFLTKYGQEKGTMKELFHSDVDLDYNYRILSCTSHPIEENNRVLQFESLLRNYTSHANSWEIKNEMNRNIDELLCNLMSESHKSYSDCGLGTAQTDLLVSLLRNKNHGIIGAKISGGGGGGSIAVLMRNMNDSTLNVPQPLSDMTHMSDSATHQSIQAPNVKQSTAAFLDGVKERYFKETGLHCTVRAGRSGPLKYHGVPSRSFSVSSTSSDSTSSIGSNNVGREVISSVDCNTAATATAYAPGANVSGISDSPKSRILIVNHGYPPAFNGGSEVYAQTLALHLLESQEFSAVSVMAREHDPFREDYEMRKTVDEANPHLPVYLLNYPREAAYYQFLSTSIDNSFRTLLQELQPNIVHFHHLNHLSLNLPKIAKEEFNAKVVYTLHDYWLMCPRGQFLVTGTTSIDRREPWQQCNGQNDKKCAVDCYTNRYSGGDVISEETDLIYWTDWIKRRMAAAREACTYVDAFIAPSKYLEEKFVDQFCIPDYKMVYHPYGFDRNRLVGRQREYMDASINNTSIYAPSMNATDGPSDGHAINNHCVSVANNDNDNDNDNDIAASAVTPDICDMKGCGIVIEDLSSSPSSSSSSPYVFAYIGRHQPSKGINLLVDAALHLITEVPSLLGKFIVKIYGRADMNATSSLKRKITEALPNGLDSQVFQVSLLFILYYLKYAFIFKYIER